MSALVAAVVVALISAPAPVPAQQQWSAEQQEVLDFTNRCWDLWNQGGAPAQEYLDECWADDISFWWSDFTLPFGKPWVAKAGLEWLKRNDIVAFDVQPHTITVHGDVAVIQYQLLELSDMGTPPLQQWAVARTDVLHRMNGRWLVIAVHQHAVARPEGGN